MQVSQYLIFTVMPLTSTSLMRGSLNCGVCPPPSALPSYPSGSGGCALRGIIPGSLPEVRSKRTKTCRIEEKKTQI